MDSKAIPPSEAPCADAALRQRARDRLDRRAARRRFFLARADDFERLRRLRDLCDHLLKAAADPDPAQAVLLRDLKDAVTVLESRCSIEGLIKALRAEGLYRPEDKPDPILDALTPDQLALTEDEAEDAGNDVSHPYYGRGGWKPPE